ncbi:hypothetical protein ZYGR_0AV00560 [Zygosaccharomyces rouxii]|uniref:GABA-specific permease n=1 Tax=Zygosaccharomyces rouxii TaxID=4956 RepID=A0A1Q3AIE1_ZYGRO|nr:hypothetical protein ZYGR_0AV00560 [Zygosaccharomyces rouxii]
MSDSKSLRISPVPSLGKGDVQVYTSAGHLRSIRSKTGAGEVNYINAATSNNDNQLLAEIGYKPELERKFSTLQVFGIAFSIMGLLPSIASELDDGLAGGPVSTVWGWFIAGIFIFLVGVTMAENSSAIPTAGGLYFWTYHYAPEGYKAAISFVIGIGNSLALAAGVCSIDYGFAEEVLAAVVVSKDGNWDMTQGKLYGVYAGCVILTIMVTCVASGWLAKMQSVSIYSNLFIIVLFLIAVPIGTKVNRGGFNDGHFIFAEFENLSDWSNGWQFFLAGFTPIVWTISSFDSCVHQAEEAKDASKAVPIGIMGSIFTCWILGWVINIVLMACIDRNMDRVINSPYQLGMAQIIFDSLGKNWTIAFLSLMAFCQFLMGASSMTAASRQIWAFARDDGMPLSNILKKVDPKFHVPFYAAICSGLMSLLLGLLILIDDAAAEALFSLAIAGNYLAWLTPNFLRLTWGRDVFRPGPFYLGKFWSPLVNWTTVIFMAFIIIMVMFPTQKSGINKENMNYACVIGPGTWLLSLIYYWVYKKKEYHGPKSNLDDEEYAEAVGPEVLDAILSNGDTTGYKAV